MKFFPLRAFSLLAEPSKLFDDLAGERNALQGIMFLLFINFGFILSLLLMYPQGRGRSLYLLFFGTGCCLLLMLATLALFTSLIHFAAEMLGSTGRIFTTFSLFCVSLLPLSLATPLSIVSRFLDLSFLSILVPVFFCLKIWVLVLTIFAIRSSYGTGTAEAIIIFFIPVIIFGVLAFSLVAGGMIFLFTILHSIVSQSILF